MGTLSPSALLLTLCESKTFMGVALQSGRAGQEGGLKVGPAKVVHEQAGSLFIQF